MTSREEQAGAANRKGPGAADQTKGPIRSVRSIPTAQPASQAQSPAALIAQATQLAVEVVDETRTQLMAALRFMDVALWRMPLARKRLARPMGTDGYLFYLDPIAVVTAYKADANEVVRDYLHAILHCVFRHTFDDRHPDTALWDVACDVAVESCAMELAGVRYPSARDVERSHALETLKQACPRLTAAKIYNVLAVALGAQHATSSANITGHLVGGTGGVRYANGTGDSGNEGDAGNSESIGDASGIEHTSGITATVCTTPLPSSLSPRLIASLPELFARDDHSAWTRTEERPAAQIIFDDKVELIGTSDDYLRGQREELTDDEENEQHPGVDMPGSPAPSSGGTAAEGMVEGGDRFVDTAALEEGEATFADMFDAPKADFDDITWTDISHLIAIDMEAFIGRAGIDAGTFEVNLSVANRKTYDYRDFLKRFSSLSEEMKVSTEEFDYVYYTYGLSKYGNMPLIEPLEYQESNRVREFVIAIDTSASCAGGLVKHFVEKTFDVLKSTAAFGRKVNVHIVQCDCEVRKDVKITETADIDESFADFTARGFGGTDFRPVFAYVDELIETREFTNLKGMIYLTDGIGKYPTQPPDYECAFVFVDETYERRTVPAWAMKVVMTEDEILEL